MPTLIDEFDLDIRIGPADDRDTAELPGRLAMVTGEGACPSDACSDYCPPHSGQRGCYA